MRTRKKKIRGTEQPEKITAFDQLTDEETLTLPSEQWPHYWPFMSNVWTKKHRVRSTETKTNNTYSLELSSV